MSALPFPEDFEAWTEVRGTDKHVMWDTGETKLGDSRPV